jgi:hypothetical protein
VAFKRDIAALMHTGWTTFDLSGMVAEIAAKK